VLWEAASKKHYYVNEVFKKAKENWEEAGIKRLYLFYAADEKVSYEPYEIIPFSYSAPEFLKTTEKLEDKVNFTQEEIEKIQEMINKEEGSFMKKETWGVVIVGLMLASYIVAYSRRIASWLGLRKTEEELEEGLDDKEENEE
jgi:hypothetical protein